MFHGYRVNGQGSNTHTHTHTPLLRRINAKDPLLQQLTADKSKWDCKKKTHTSAFEIEKKSTPSQHCEGGGSSSVIGSTGPEQLVTPSSLWYITCQILFKFICVLFTSTPCSPSDVTEWVWFCRQVSSPDTDVNWTTSVFFYVWRRLAQCRLPPPHKDHERVLGSAMCFTVRAQFAAYNK